MSDQAEIIIRELVKDPEFVALSKSNPDKADAIVDQLVQEKTGRVPKTQNLLQRAIKQTGFGTSGVMGAAAKDPVKTGEVAPDIGQTAGSVLGTMGGTMIGHPFMGQTLGGTLGRAGGETLRQITRGATGQGFDVSQIGKQAQLGLGTELIGTGITRAGSAVFSGTAAKQFRKMTGENLKALKEIIIKKGAPVDVVDFLLPLQEAVDQFGKQFQKNPLITKVFQRRVINELDRVAGPTGLIQPRDLMKAKEAVDDMLKQLGVFGKKGKPGALRIGGDYDAGDFLLKARDMFNKKVSSVAYGISDKLGQGYEAASKAFAKIAKKFPDKPGVGGIVPEIARASAAVQGAKGNIGEAAKSLGAAEILEASGIPKILFGGIQGIGHTLPTATASILDRFGRKK